MKFLLIILLLFPLFAFNQKASFKEIRLYANPKFFNAKEKYPTIIIPVVVTRNSAVNKIINYKIKEEIFSFEESDDFKTELKNRINEGLTDVSYEVTYNKNYFLSLNVFVQGSGGSHISFYNTYFNFDLRNGSEISLSHLIKKEKIDSFKTKVFQDRRDSLDEYKQEEFKLIKEKIIDSTDYQWIVDHLNEENVMDENFGEEFILSNEGIEIIAPIEFPSVMRSQEPTFHLRYSFKEIRPIITAKFSNQLIK